MQLSARDRTLLAGAAGLASVLGIGYLIQRELRRWRVLSAHMAQVLLSRILHLGQAIHRRNLSICIP